MNRWIAFLRGINVGGSKRLPMKDLREALEAAGHDNVQTYIQSGNLVFDSPHESYRDVSSGLTELLREQFDMTPRSHVYSPQDMTRMIQLNPYREDGLETPKFVHFFLLAEPARDAQLDELEDIKAHNERFELTDEVFYLHAPDGIGHSKLAEKLDRLLAVPMTGRNMRTIYKVAALAGLEVEEV